MATPMSSWRHVWVPIVLVAGCEAERTSASWDATDDLVDAIAVEDAAVDTLRSDSQTADEGSSEVRPPEPDGACTGDADRSALDELSEADLETRLRECMLPLAMAGTGPGTDDFVQRAAGCLRDSTGLSEPCTVCYAVSAECSFEGCGRTCLPAPSAPECVACRCGHSGFADCLTPLAACTGLDSDRACGNGEPLPP